MMATAITPKQQTHTIKTSIIKDITTKVTTTSTVGNKTMVISNMAMVATMMNRRSSIILDEQFADLNKRLLQCRCEQPISTRRRIL